MTARQVYLPAGDWYDWHTGERVAGPRFVVAPTPMDRIPLYARGGAVIPMWPEAPASTGGYHPAAVELHLFVPARRDRDVVPAGGRRPHVRRDSGGVVRTTFALLRSGDGSSSAPR